MNIKIPKWFWLGVLTASLAIACIEHADAETFKAPVVRPASDAVMVQTGWYTYERPDRAIVLYCVEQTEVLLTCVVYAYPVPGTAGVVMMPDVVRSELGS